MSEALEAELNNWSVQDLKDVLDRYKLPTGGLKRALIERLAASNAHKFTGPDYDRWTITALKAAARKAGVPASISRRSLLVDKLRQAHEKKETTEPAAAAANPSPKRRVRHIERPSITAHHVAHRSLQASTGSSPAKAPSPAAASPSKRRTSSSAAEAPASAPSPSPTVTISPRRRKLEITGPITKRVRSALIQS